MKKQLFALFAVPVLLFGCSNDSDIDTNEGPIDASSLMVEVEILIPEKVEVNETVKLEARLTQADEPVDDAELVQFEVWESGYRDKGEIIDGELTSDGIYSAETVFDHDGVYYVYAHSTARGLHVMPKQQIIVGNPDMSQVIEDSGEATMDFIDKHQSEEHSHSEEDEHSTHTENHEEEITIE